MDQLREIYDNGKTIGYIIEDYEAWKKICVERINRLYGTHYQALTDTAILGFIEDGSLLIADGVDFYVSIAASVLGVSEDKVTAEQRFIAKEAIFFITYRGLSDAHDQAMIENCRTLVRSQFIMRGVINEEMEGSSTGNTISTSN